MATTVTTPTGETRPISRQAIYWTIGVLVVLALILFFAMRRNYVNDATGSRTPSTTMERTAPTDTGTNTNNGAAPRDTNTNTDTGTTNNTVPNRGTGTGTGTDNRY